MVWCSCLSMLRKFLKPLSTSALPRCRPDVIYPVLASHRRTCVVGEFAWGRKYLAVIWVLNMMFVSVFRCLHTVVLNDAFFKTLYKPSITLHNTSAEEDEDEKCPVWMVE